MAPTNQIEQNARTLMYSRYMVINKVVKMNPKLSTMASLIAHCVVFGH